MFAGEIQNEAILASANNTKKKNTQLKNTKKERKLKIYWKKYDQQSQRDLAWHNRIYLFIEHMGNFCNPTRG